MATTVVDTDVLIVGAGPVGLFLANECARRGLRYRIVETHAGQSVHSKALAIFPRTLEILDMAGVVAPFLETANRVTSVAVMAHHRNLAHMRFTPEESPYPFVAMVPQDVTEKLLVKELGRRGGKVEYGTTFSSAEQQGERLVASIEHNGVTSKVAASIVVGCDGAHSAVRDLLKIPFAGGDYQGLFVLADVETNEALPAEELELCPSELGPIAIFPMSATRRRVVATVEKKEGEAPSLELVRRIIQERGPGEIEARTLHWSSYFHIHHRHVATLRSGRMLLAGDAAHIHSPFGGQGMNTGLHDVWNLAWKVKLFLDGCGNEQLLESYSAERIPVIQGVIETTHHLTQIMGTPNKFAQALRDAVIPMVSRLAPFQHAFVQRLSELGIAYGGSPIIEGPGKRYFDDSLRGGRGIGNYFVLMIGKEDRGKNAAEKLCEAFRDVVEPRVTERPGVTLVRPDGYAAYHAESGSESALKELESVLARQINGPHATGSRQAKSSAAG